MSSYPLITVGIADDQPLFLTSLALLIDSFSSFKVTVRASDGHSLLQQLASMAIPPDILLVDVEMPVMNGIVTAMAIANLYPQIRIVGISMKDDEGTMNAMLKAGCCAFLLKDIHPGQLEKELLRIHQRGYYDPGDRV
jgi:DNA-binding NarL/FixJ family response regulator